MQNNKRGVRLRTFLFCILHSALCISLAGCVIPGVLAQAMPKVVPASYSGLKGHSVAVMVWVNPISKTDWPTMSIDLCASVQAKLLAAQKDPNPDDLKGTTFPVTPASIARFQEDHPEAEMQPIDQTTKTVGVDRLIYIEVSQFQTRSDSSDELYRGQLVANVKVIELNHGQTKTGYEEDKLTATFPPNAPEDGVMNLGDARTYAGTVEAFATKLAQRFYKHEEERGPGE